MDETESSGGIIYAQKIDMSYYPSEMGKKLFMVSDMAKNKKILKEKI